MGAKNYRELDAWRLADEVRIKVIEFTALPPASKDFKYCNQIRDSASSVAANIAEGFARRSPPDFARFLSIAKGSLSETQDRVRDGSQRHYISEERTIELMRLTARCDRVITNLRAYLWSCGKKR
jgi:four helix bundle protein